MPPPRQSRSGAGEIVEVQGGHIVRSTGRKDRHSKVCTSKGPRDRRVRLSAPTAIQFYDVQDRLGYDRPSKAVDWLMENAKSAIDELAERPAWNPTATMPPPSGPRDDYFALADSGKKPAFASGGAGSSDTSFLPPSMDSDSIADTIKSFFPLPSATSTTPSSSSSIGHQSYPPDPLSRSNSQDLLRLSLQSFQDPNFHHPNSTHHETQNPNACPQQGLFSSSTAFTFDGGWPEQGQRLFSWNGLETTGGGGGGGGGYLYNVPPPQAVPLPGHGQFFTQRGPLQSNNSSSIRAWADPMAPAAHHQMHDLIYPSASTIGFASVSGGFPGFHIPARIQGEEEQDGIFDKSSSASHHKLRRGENQTTMERPFP